MRLVEDGELRLDQPVRGLLGDDLPLIDDGVTIEHLLAHTSGIGDYLDEDSDWEVSDYVLTVPGTRSPRRRRSCRCSKGTRRSSPRASGSRTATAGYMVLAIVLERATGGTFHDVVRRLVIEPAGLERTGFLPLNELPADAALGYLSDEGDS